MLKILEKYNQLPEAIRDRMSSVDVLKAIKKLEAEYKISLHTIIMRILIGEINSNKLIEFFAKDLKVDLVKAQTLSKELKDILELKVETQVVVPEDIADKNIVSPEKIAIEKKEEKIKELNNLDAFSEHDEEEIKQISKDMDKVKIGDSSSLDEQVNKIFEQLKIGFSSQFLLDRFKQIVKANLSGVRDLDNTFALLLKSFDQGGVNLSEDDAKKTIEVLSKVNSKNEPVSPPPVVPTVDSFASKNINAGEIKIKEELAQPKVDSENIARDVEYNLEKEIEKRKEKIEKSKQKVVNKVIEKNNTAPILKQDPKVNTGGKMRKKPLTMTPIDELRYLNLVDFRRLHEDPTKAIIKILRKIKLLEGKKANRKIEGIQAWRESPVNKMYLNIGQKSITNGKSIQDIIKELGDKESLNQQEFNAVGKLNYRLRSF